MPRNVTSLVGKSAYLGCRVRNLGNKTVAWIRHRDLHILTVGTYTYTTDQRFQTSFHRDIDEWTLQIKWAQKRDAGAYECQISTQPVRAFSVNLNIVVPTATILGGPDLYVDKGSTINLTCAIKFSPEPPTHIFWYHQDKVLSEDSERGGISFVTSKEDFSKSILLIDNADLPDSGKYSCYPSNTEIASIRVHVLNGERPEAMQTSGASRITTFIGYNPSFIKLTTPISTTTISTILSTMTYSSTTLIQIFIAVILLKILGNCLQFINNFDIINVLYTCKESKIDNNNDNINNNNNHYIINENNNNVNENKLGYEHHKIVDINKNFKTKIKNTSYRKNHYYLQQQYKCPGLKKEQQQPFQNNSYCRCSNNNYYHHFNCQHNYYNNQYHSFNSHIREKILALQLYNENNYNICYYCSSNYYYYNYNYISNSKNSNESNIMTIHYNCQRKQEKNRIKNNNKLFNYKNGENLNDFKNISKTSTTITITTANTIATTTSTITTTNFNQLKMMNYLLKSSSLLTLPVVLSLSSSSSLLATISSYRHILNIKNYDNNSAVDDNDDDDDDDVNTDDEEGDVKNGDVENCHYCCCCICFYYFHCSLKNENKNSGEYRKQMSQQYLER
ncbi:probable serine/threonine-protein kinase clkA [Condylostylus longicornis]|uniref:probable serine/threonine-protein kinase clkA n=1 Tax=Condylostylus longicornis TaxID=2530218 RepID=UPI00244E2F31|nr:probable serine/threonine-protein kinase clkA [Condylostylus longicornis]